MKKNQHQAGRTPGTSKRCRIIGKGRDRCVALLLKDWWIQESFTNVIIHCKEAGPKRTHLRANASILAATSPFLKNLLSDYSGLEEDAVVLLPDYTQTAVFYALQYIYTGQVALKSSKILLDEVKCLLTDIGLSFQTTSVMTVDEKLATYRVKDFARKERNHQETSETSTSAPVALDESRSVVEHEPPVTVQTYSSASPVASNKNPSNEGRPLILSYSRPVKKRKISPGEGIDCIRMQPESVNLQTPLPPDTSETSLSNVEKTTLQTGPLPSQPTQIAASTFVQSLQREMQVWGPAAPVTVDEPSFAFAYDSSPQYLQQIPAKQYGRRNSMKRAVEKNCRIRVNKVHVTSQTTPIELGKDSIFADVGECTRSNEHDYSLAEYPPRQSAIPVKVSAESNKADEEACRLLREEREKHRKLKRALRQLEARVITVRKKTTELAKKGGPEKKKKRDKSDAMLCCDKCGKMVKSSWMKNHKKIHEDHQHCCEKCGRTFTLRCQLLLHFKRQHMDIIAETGGHPCTVCGQVFKFPKYLKHHMTLHTGEKRYACKYCDRRFRSELVRSNHQRVHTGERPFVCDICGKGFAQKVTLTVHLKAHEKFKLMNGVSSKGRPCFQCSKCSAQFRSEPNFLEHVARHDGDVPVLPCKSCHRVFTSVKDLKYHEESHLSKIYSCALCGKEFNKRASYYKHRSKEHQGLSKKKGLNTERENEQLESSSEMKIEI